LETRWQKQRKYLVGSVDCSDGPTKLKGGGVGWYEVAVQEWLCDWKLRLCISITHPKPGYPYPPSAGKLVPSRPGARCFSSDNDWLDVIVENEIVEVWFPVPDCIQPFQKSPSFGCSGGATIALGTGIYHCQARLIAQNSDHKATLRRAGRTLEFIRTDLGRTTVVGAIENCIPPFDWEALVHRLQQG